MATKTISIDLEAYEKLVQGRSTPQESFSSVIKRSEIRPLNGRCGAFLNAIKRTSLLTENHFATWDKATDSPPEDPWQD